MRRGIVLLVGLALVFSSGAFANEAPPPPKKNDPNAPPPKPPSSLTGNAMPHCDLGSYPAGKTSNYGARGRSECF
jgi:hypothetical protein